MNEHGKQSQDQHQGSAHERHPEFRKFDLDAKLREASQEKDWTTKVNRLWDLCQEHLDHDMDQLRKLRANPDQIFLAIRDGMHDWSAHRNQIVDALIAGDPQKSG